MSLNGLLRYLMKLSDLLDWWLVSVCFLLSSSQVLSCVVALEEVCSYASAQLCYKFIHQ
jgi:hypothetical protein